MPLLKVLSSRNYTLFLKVSHNLFFIYRVIYIYVYIYTSSNNIKYKLYNKIKYKGIKIVKIQV